MSSSATAVGRSRSTSARAPNPRSSSLSAAGAVTATGMAGGSSVLRTEKRTLTRAALASPLTTAASNLASIRDAAIASHTSRVAAHSVSCPSPSRPITSKASIASPSGTVAPLGQLTLGTNSARGGRVSAAPVEPSGRGAAAGTACFGAAPDGNSPSPAGACASARSAYREAQNKSPGRKIQWRTANCVTCSRCRG